jgi:hypothetical protein
MNSSQQPEMGIRIRLRIHIRIYIHIRIRIHQKKIFENIRICIQIYLLFLKKFNVF